MPIISSATRFVVDVTHVWQWHVRIIFIFNRIVVFEFRWMIIKCSKIILIHSQTKLRYNSKAPKTRTFIERKTFHIFYVFYGDDAAHSHHVVCQSCIVTVVALHYYYFNMKSNFRNWYNIGGRNTYKINVAIVRMKEQFNVIRKL